MAEIISWLKVIGYVSVPVVLFLAVSWRVKNYKKKNAGLKIDQHTDKITKLKHSSFPSGREKASDIVDDNFPGEINGQMELERRRFAGEKL